MIIKAVKIKIKISMPQSLENNKENFNANNSFKIQDTQVFDAQSQQTTVSLLRTN